MKTWLSFRLARQIRAIASDAHPNFETKINAANGILSYAAAATKDRKRTVHLEQPI
jgi:hypothetical protein